MKTAIQTSSPYLYVSTGNSYNYCGDLVTDQPGAAVGELRYSGTDIYAWTGTDWTLLGETVIQIDTDFDLDATIEWVRKKKEEEERIEKLCEKFPSLAKAKENYDIIKALVENDLNEE